MQEIKKNKGITLIALVITIIILLILAGISMATLMGENGLVTRAQDAKEQTEIGREKEIISLAAMKNKIDNEGKVLDEEGFRKTLNVEEGEGKTELSDLGEEFEVLFKESGRYYSIDKNGNIVNMQELVEDKSPGNIEKDENGNDLDGSKEKPYQVWCIEDLVVLSNMVLGEGIKIQDGVATEITQSNLWEGKHIELKRSLNFKSKYSYANSQRTDFGDINGNIEDENVLITEMTTGTGFRPIGKFFGKSFRGNFNGNNYEIKNLYDGALFGSVEKATIKDLSVYGIHGKTNKNGIIARIENGVEIDGLKNHMNVYNPVSSAAGIVSYGNGTFTIRNCCNYGKIEGTGYGVGGILGYTNTTTLAIIENSCNMGDVNFYKNGVGYSGCGGIIGLNQFDTNKVKIYNSYNIGKIEGKAVNNGLIVGAVGPLEISNVYYVKDDKINPVGRSNYIGSFTEKTEIEIRSQEFVDLLNSNIDDNSNWKKWKIGENGYPVLE